MATKNLGKVAFVWKGDYSNIITYNKYDVIFDGESSFISTIENNLGHPLSDSNYWKYLCRGSYSTLGAHINNLNNPHSVTKAQLGLGSADDTSDMDKPVSTATQNALNLKSDKVRNVIAGTGLTGGGDLSADRTLNVVSANDGITINVDNIQLNTVDNVTSTSTTQPLAANQGKVLNDNLVQLGADLNENIEPSLAEILNAMAGRIIAIESIIKNSLYKNMQVDSLEIVKAFNIYGATNLVLTGTAAPSVVPDFVGQFYVNTTGGVTYQAKGVSSTSDWKQTSN